MDKVLELELKITEARSELSKLNDVETPDDTQEKRMETLTKEIRSLDTRLAAAKVMQTSTNETRTDNAEDAEEKERRELRSKCMVGRFLGAALQGHLVTGAEGEYLAAVGLEQGKIPMDLWQPPEKRHEDGGETRAATPSPSTVGVNMAMIEPFVFAPSIASRLGIEIRDVPTGTYAIPTITTAPSTAAPKAKDAAADATAGALTVQSATPKRVPAQLTV